MTIIVSEQHVPIYAAYLYDAMQLYYAALATLIIHSNRTVEALEEIDMNGTLIVDAIKAMKNYAS